MAFFFLIENWTCLAAKQHGKWSITPSCIYTSGGGSRAGLWSVFCLSFAYVSVGKCCFYSQTSASQFYWIIYYILPDKTIFGNPQHSLLFKALFYFCTLCFLIRALKIVLVAVLLEHSSKLDVTSLNAGHSWLFCVHVLPLHDVRLIDNSKMPLVVAGCLSLHVGIAMIWTGDLSMVYQLGL